MFNIDMDKVKSKAKALTEMASETVVKTVNAAGRAANITKVKFKIASKEIEIKNVYKELGKTVYDAYKDEKEANDDAIAEKCVFIDSCNNEIAELKASIEKSEEKSEDVQAEEEIKEIEED